MKNNQLQKSIKKLIEVSFKDGRMVEAQVGKSIRILKSLPRSEAIQALSEYLKFLKMKEREHTLYIETTFPLTSAQIKKAKKVVEGKTTGGELGRTITKVLVNINPEILGGFKLRVGDEIFDESVLGKINQVKEVIANGGSNQSN